MAFDTQNGKLLWQQRFTFHPDAGNRGHLLFHDGLLYIPVSTIQETQKEAASGSIFRGNIVALAASNGRIVWEQNGRFWMLDRDSGALVWSTTLGSAGLGGGIAADASIDHHRALLWSNRAFDYLDPETHPMDIAALDAATGKALWSNPNAHPAGSRSAGFLGADVYFVGSLDGRVLAYNALNGRRVWISPVTGPIGSSVVISGDRVFFCAGIPGWLGGQDSEGGGSAFAVPSLPANHAVKGLNSRPLWPHPQTSAFAPSPTQ